MPARIWSYVRRHHVALLALFVALGGTSYAGTRLVPRNSVGSAQVINGSLKTVDLSHAAATELRGARGQRGSPGAVGATGSQGVQGAQGLQGVQGAQGLPGAPGATGPQGAQGNQGPAGLNGAAVAARIRSSAGVQTSAGGEQVSVPLATSSWTQAADEVDLGPYGQLTYTAPDASACAGTGTASLALEIDVDGASFFTAQFTSLLDGGTRTVRIGGGAFLFEPSAPTARNATAKVSAVCLSVALIPRFTVSDVRFDVIRAS